MMITGLFSMTVAAQDHALVRRKQFNLDDNVAISGYDPVAYFKANRAVKGKKEHAVNHQGVIYYFSSIEDKNGCDKFEHTCADATPRLHAQCRKNINRFFRG